ncbi:hypothetical protein B0A69_18600 [Chryseobacterium shigense]|uniref:HEAT repeat-containing protein n=1 Tax=Chryseobacterium shigense TaxID=297244 RepID=A0A1N7K3D9_9FLAO|nr:hypothetical protein [Chryseobacterium shigense]PQA91091.1 hypothetical protein B0A69_18600 [Chryseobacterium shigense]SIS56067.1 hypothetical protein SAMN05421639_10843 [Chryseobacterium shigense]
MKLSGIFGAVFIVFLFSCHKKEEKEPVLSDLLIEDFDCTKDAVFDTLNVPHHLLKIVKDISSLNVYETDQGGKGSIGTPANFKNFQKLYNNASEQELLSLTNNKNSVVAVYAAIGLSEKNNKYIVPVFQKILNRKETIPIQNGCLLSDDHPAEPLYWKYYNQLKPEELKSDQYLKQLDSMLLFIPDSSELILTTALRNRTYSDGLNKQIAKLAFENHRTPALLYLNSWHKKDYADPLQKEFIRLIENNSIDNEHRRYYLSILLSFNNKENKKIILNYISKDSQWKEEDLIISQLENSGITSEDYN